MLFVDCEFFIALCFLAYVRMDLKLLLWHTTTKLQRKLKLKPKLKFKTETENILELVVKLKLKIKSF